MNLEYFKSAAAWWALLLPVVLGLIAMGGSGFVAVLRFVLESLNSFGAA